MKLETPLTAGRRKAARVSRPGLATGIAILALLASLAAPATAAADVLGTPIFAGDFESGTMVRCLGTSARTASAASGEMRVARQAGQAAPTRPATSEPPTETSTR